MTEKKYKAALISMQSKSSKMTVEAMQKYFQQVDDLNIKKIEISLENEPKVLYEGKPIKGYDCIFAKGSFRYADLLRSITTLLSTESYMPVKASAFSVGHDKLLTQLKLQREGIPMPKTYISATTAAAKNILKHMNYPIVMKFPKGTHGKGVVFADSYESACSLLDALVALNQAFIIQEYVETGGVDYRALVVGDKVVASMKRKAQHGEKRANLHAGGIGEAILLDEHSKKIAVKASQSIGIGVCAVDIIEGIKGPLVLEVNLSPGLQGISAATHIDVADHIAQYLFKETEKFRKQEN